MSKDIRKLSSLARGDTATIVGVATTADDRVQRLLEMGFIEGSEVEVAHECPLGKDPFAVRIRGGLIALRRSDADLILVSAVGGDLS